MLCTVCRRARELALLHDCLAIARTGQSQVEHGRIELSVAITLYRARDMTFWLPQAEAALMQVHAGSNTPAE